MQLRDSPSACYSPIPGACCPDPQQMQRNAKRSRRNSRAARSRTPSKPGISIIGAGRLGTALGLALKHTGYRVEIVVTKRSSSARRAAKAIGASTFAVSSGQLNRLTSRQTGRLSRSAVILIATPDDVIQSVAQRLADVFESLPARPGVKFSGLGRIALHTSGALSSEVLDPLRNVGFAAGSIHPLVSISDPLSGAKPFRQSFFCVEGDRPAVRAATSMARALGGQTFTINRDCKALYHAAAVMASGNVVALFDIALEMLERCGLSRRRSHQVLLPLLESSVTNLSRMGSSEALTGPFARADLATVEKHLRAIESKDLCAAMAAYLLLGRRSIALAKKRKPRPAGLDRVTRVLSAKTRNSL